MRIQIKLHKPWTYGSGQTVQFVTQFSHNGISSDQPSYSHQNGEKGWQKNISQLVSVRNRPNITDHN